MVSVYSSAQKSSILTDLKQNRLGPGIPTNLKIQTQGGLIKSNGGGTSSMFHQSVFSGNSSVGSITHKDYIKNMLLTKFNKKYAVTNEKGITTTDFQTNQIINNEVLNFIRSEKLNRENLKVLEMKIDQKLQSFNKGNNTSTPNAQNGNSQKEPQRLTRLSSQQNNLKINVANIISEEKQKMRSMSRVNSKLGTLLPQINSMGASQGNLQMQNILQDVLNDQFDQNNLEDGLNIDAKFSQTQDVSQLQQDYDLLNQHNNQSGSPRKQNDLMTTSPSYQREKDRQIKSELSNDDEWAEVDKYRQLMHDRDLQLQKDKKEQFKVFTKTVLDEQVIEKKKRQQEQKQLKVRNDQMVISQVQEYRNHQDRIAQENHQKLLDQKQMREMQLQEYNEFKKQQKKAKRVYEKQLVDDLKLQIQAEKDKQTLKREKLKEMAEEMKKENEINKQMKVENKMKQRVADVQLCKQAIEIVNEQERKKVEEFQRREKRIQEFMSKLEKTAIAEENKKHTYLEEQARKYEERKQREDMFEEERRKKRVMDRREELKNTLRDQMEEKNLKKQFVKNMNNAYVQIFKDKHERDIEREKRLEEQLKLKQMEVQETILRQIEEKRARQKGMTNDEFEFNKDLLKEIVTKRKELRETVNFNTTQSINAQQTTQLPAYEIYNL